MKVITSATHGLFNSIMEIWFTCICPQGLTASGCNHALSFHAQLEMGSRIPFFVCCDCKFLFEISNAKGAIFIHYYTGEVIIYLCDELVRGKGKWVHFWHELDIRMASVVLYQLKNSRRFSTCVLNKKKQNNTRQGGWNKTQEHEHGGSQNNTINMIKWEEERVLNIFISLWKRHVLRRDLKGT